MDPHHHHGRTPLPDKVRWKGIMEAVVQWLAFGHENLRSRVRVPISAGYFSFLSITAEWLG